MSAKRAKTEGEEEEAEIGNRILAFGKHKGMRAQDLPPGYLWWLSLCTVPGARDEYVIKTPGESPEAMLSVLKYHEDLARWARAKLYAERDAAFRSKVALLKNRGMPDKCAACGRGMPKIMQDTDDWDRRFHKGCWKRLRDAEQREFDPKYSAAAASGT
jgi:hypothetical protein